MCVITGVIVIQGCVHGVHLGRMAAAGFHAEAPVQRRDSGKLQQPGVRGYVQLLLSHCESSVATPLLLLIYPGASEALGDYGLKL